MELSYGACQIDLPGIIQTIKIFDKSRYVFLKIFSIVIPSSRVVAFNPFDSSLQLIIYFWINTPAWKKRK